MKKVPFEYVDCSRCAALERQLAEAQRKLDAVKRVESALRHAGNPSPDTKVDRIMWLTALPASSRRRRMAENFTHPLRRGEKIGTTATDRLRASVDNLRNENARLRGVVGRGRTERDALQERVEEFEAHDCGLALTKALEIAERQLALAERWKKALDETPHDYKCACYDDFDCDCYKRDHAATIEEEEKR